MKNLNLNRSSGELGNLNESSSHDISSNQSIVYHSGNSDVNVHIKIDVDVFPIAYAMLYSLLAKDQISNKEFQLAIRELEEYKSK